VYEHEFQHSVTTWRSSHLFTHYWMTTADRMVCEVQIELSLSFYSNLQDVYFDRRTCSKLITRYST